MTIKQFITTNNITITNKWSAKHPGWDDSHDPSANHYKSTLHYTDQNGKRQATFYYTKGSGLTGEPTAEELIECLHSDYTSIENGLHEFASDFDYPQTQAKKIFDNIETNSQKLFKLFGFEKFQDFKTLTEDEESE